MARRLLGLLALCAGSACAFTDPGEGTGNLAVDVHLSYAPTLGDTTAVQSVVLSAGQPADAPLEGAGAGVVTLIDSDTRAQFVVGAGAAEVAGYHRHLEVKISSGDDSLQCKLEGPSRHTLTRPLQGQLISKGRDLRIRWQTGDGRRADEVDIKLERAGFAATLTHDQGRYTIRAAALVPGNDTLTVVRRNRLSPKGAAGQSQIRIQYEVSVALQVQGS